MMTGIYSGKRTLAVCLWLFVLAVLSPAAFSGEPAAADKPKPLEEMTVEELRAYQAFFYPSGGRDPLTMRLPTSEEMGAEKPVSENRIAPTLDQMEAYLIKTLETITQDLKTLNFESAIKISDDAINVLDNEWPPLNPEQIGLVRMAAEIRNYNRLAIRLKTQADVKTEFDTLLLRVDGVIWSPVDAKAIVNGRSYAAGEALLQERNQGDLRIETVEEHGVVFQFKGMRFRKGVELYAPPAGAED